MRYKYIEIGILLAFGIALGACKKELNVFPGNANVDGDVITDQETAQRVLTGVYYRFANGSFDDLDNISTKWTDIFEDVPSQMVGTIYDPENAYAMSTFHFSPSYDVIDSLWMYGFNLVNAANGFIKNASPVSNIPTGVKQQMLAEATFLRAFGNAELLFYFAQYRDPSSQYGIILRDKFVTATTLNLPRSDVAAAYTSILADLDIAIDGLPSSNSAIYFANVWDARLLKARVLINRGSAGDYEQVADLTKHIIANSPYTLEDSVKDIFRTKGYSSREVMMAIKPYPGENYKWTNFYCQATDSLFSLITDDARNQWLYTKDDNPYSPYIKITKYAPIGPRYPVTPPLSVNCYAFRLTEAYLLEAEAIALSGADPGVAKTLLKTVMSHAGAGATELAAVDNATTPEALQLEIVKENMRNFIYENGVDWLALRRLPFATIQQLNPNIKDINRLILPIPSAELKFNNVIQNPGY